MVQLRNALSLCGLYDLGFNGDKFTWTNNRVENQFTKERLHRACGSTTWINSFTNHSVSHLDCTQSDHKPLLVQTHNQPPMNEVRIFIFELDWKTQEECGRLIKSAWESSVNNPSNLQGTLHGLTLCQEKLKA